MVQPSVYALINLKDKDDNNVGQVAAIGSRLYFFGDIKQSVPPLMACVDPTLVEFFRAVVQAWDSRSVIPCG